MWGKRSIRIVEAKLGYFWINMKTKRSKFQKWYECISTTLTHGNRISPKESWNAACKSILRKVKVIKKNCDGFPQHEDIDYIEELVKEMIEK